MTIKLVLQAEDYLVFQLYTASISKDIQKKRLRMWLAVTGLAFFIAAAFYVGHNMFLFYYCLVVGVASLFFFQMYQGAQYKKHFRKYVFKNYQYRFGKESLLDIQHDHIEVKDVTSDGKLFTSEIASIHEIGTHYFIQFKVGMGLIIPKRQVAPSFLTDLGAILQNPGIVIEKHPDWKWK